MKIVCARCKKTMGEQAPFDKPDEVQAKCVACIAKDKEVQSRFDPEPTKPGETQEIVLGSGLKGTLWIPANEKEKLSLGEIAVAGRRFSCGKDCRDEFRDYLAGLSGDRIEVVFFHSITCKVDLHCRRRKKKPDPEPPKAEETKSDSISYNCTVVAPKSYVQRAFDDMADRMDRAIEIMAEMLVNARRRELAAQRECVVAGNGRDNDHDKVS